MTDDKRVIASWCLYDWANSAFTTLVVTFVYATYFTQSFAPDEGTGTALWSRGIVVSSLLIAVLSPVLGAIADRGGTRRRHMLIATAVCIGTTTVLTFVEPGREHAVWWALGLFVIANVAYEIGLVFYNSFLPTITSSARIGRVSGYGWALGYVGGLACLLVALLGFVGIAGEPWLTLPTEEGFHVRATNLLVAAWFLLFSIPTFHYLRDRPVAKRYGVGLRGAFSDLAETFRQIRRYREVVKFLVARLIYNDGLITIFAFGGIYAAGTFGMTTQEVITYGIVINVASGLGAWVFGFFDDKIGGKATVMVSIVALFFFSLLAVVAPSKAWFWVAGLGIGIFVGPNQSASRSLMGRFVPERHRSEFFGFFAFSGKATAFLGPLLLGLLSDAYNQRAGVGVVLLFFLVGGFLLTMVDEKRGIELAHRG